MYVKMWRGRVPVAETERFGDELDRTWIRDLTGLPDNRGAVTLYRIDGDEAEFIVITIWSRQRPDLDGTAPEGMVLDTRVDLGTDYEYFVRGDVALGVGLLE